MVLGVARSGYYSGWRAGRATRSSDDEVLAAEVKDDRYTANPPIFEVSHIITSRPQPTS